MTELTRMDSFINFWNEESIRDFEANHRIKSFSEYLDDLRNLPYFYTRNAAQYLLDMISFFGVREVQSITSDSAKRYRLFDLPFERSGQILYGQEDVIAKVVECLKNFILEGRVDRLIHLHGPNGSGKSLIVSILAHGLEEYSRTSDGSVFSIAWVFPKHGENDIKLGFEAGNRGSGGDGITSYAHLPMEEIEALLPCELRDPPFFLLPLVRRMKFLEEILNALPDEKQKNAFKWSAHILESELCPKCHEIFLNLLKSYGGDVLKVVRHIRVDRYVFSGRYRIGSATVSPQQSPDAQVRQLTLDASISSLPRSLQYLNLFQVLGDLVDGNHGIIEFSDFLTRPPENNKYLLNTTEKGSVGLPLANITLNEVMFATSNERHLDAFKESPEFASMKGRMLLIPVPYLLSVSSEEPIYLEILNRMKERKHITPHTSRLAAFWAILTRLHRPDPEHYPKELSLLIRKLTPIDKAYLYDNMPLTGSFKRQEVKLLREHLNLIKGEFADTSLYEGRFGASPRELREILYNCLYHNESECISPPVFFEETMRFIKDKSLYLFLQLKADNDYHDSESAIETIKNLFMDAIDAELMSSLELIPETKIEDLFERYVRHVKAFIKGEKVFSETTQVFEAPSEQVMTYIEEHLGNIKEKRTFREDILSRIGASQVEHPEEALKFGTLFEQEIMDVKKGFFQKAREKMKELSEGLLLYGHKELDLIPQERRVVINKTYDNLVEKFKYCKKCAYESVVFLIENRYRKLD